MQPRAFLRVAGGRARLPIDTRITTEIDYLTHEWAPEETRRGYAIEYNGKPADITHAGRPTYLEAAIAQTGGRFSSLGCETVIHNNPHLDTVLTAMFVNELRPTTKESDAPSFHEWAADRGAVFKAYSGVKGKFGGVFPVTQSRISWMGTPVPDVHVSTKVHTTAANHQQAAGVVIGEDLTLLSAYISPSCVHYTDDDDNRQGIDDNRRSINGGVAQVNNFNLDWRRERRLIMEEFLSVSIPLPLGAKASVDRWVNSDPEVTAIWNRVEVKGGRLILPVGAVVDRHCGHDASHSLKQHLSILYQMRRGLSFLTPVKGSDGQFGVGLIAFESLPGDYAAGERRASDYLESGLYLELAIANATRRLAYRACFGLTTGIVEVPFTLGYAVIKHTPIQWNRGRIDHLFYADSTEDPLRLLRA